MKKQMVFWLAAALVLSLTACQPRPTEPTPTPPETPTPAVEVTPEPTPTLEPELNLEPWQEAYLELLAGYETRRTEHSVGSWVYMERYTLYDMDKDGVPELFLIDGYEDDNGAKGTGEAWQYCRLYTWKNGKVAYVKPNPEDSASFWFGSLYTWPGENAVLYARGNHFNKVSLVDGEWVETYLPPPQDLPEEEVTAQFFVPEADPLTLYDHENTQPILDYTG